MFRFRLVRLLDYRRLREERLEQDLHRRQQQLQQEETRLTALQNDCRLLEEQLAASRGAALFGEEVQRWRRYYQLLKQRVATQMAAVAGAANAVATTRQELLTARQEKKILEKLREKAYQQYVYEHTRREQQHFDELTIMRSRYEH
jgi:flagellar FliJ protein